MNSVASPYPPSGANSSDSLMPCMAMEALTAPAEPFVLNEAGAPAAFTIVTPAQQTVPLVVASPHSGHFYPQSFIAQSKLDAHMLRRSEDAHVQKLFAAAPACGAPLLMANFPRAYLDANREPYELDPAMFDGPLPDYANTRSPRVLAGLGTIARMVANGINIYRGKLKVAEAEQRITACYRPYHSALESLIAQTQQRFGYCLVLDCHSMPSGLPLSNEPPRRRPLTDIVLGDCHGSSCARSMTGLAHQVLLEQELRVTRNTPYAGGFTTRHYGCPTAGVHVLQVEISRHLYMHEGSYQPLPEFEQVAQAMTVLLQAIACLKPEDLVENGG